MLKEAEKAEAKFVTEEERKDAEQAVEKADIAVDEFCSNACYDEGKQVPSPAPSASPPSKGLGSFDNYSMRMEDLSDPHLLSGSGIFWPCRSL